MYPEEGQGIPSKRIRLGGPVLQEREGVLSQDPPGRLQPGSVRGHGEQIGDTLNPIGRHAFGNLQEDGQATWWASCDVGRRPFFAYFAFFAPPVRFKPGVAHALPNSEWIGLRAAIVEGRCGPFSAEDCAFHCFGEV